MRKIKSKPKLTLPNSMLQSMVQKMSPGMKYWSYSFQNSLTTDCVYYHLQELHIFALLRQEMNFVVHGCRMMYGLELVHSPAWRTLQHHHHIWEQTGMCSSMSEWVVWYVQTVSEAWWTRRHQVKKGKIMRCKENPLSGGMLQSGIFLLRWPPTLVELGIDYGVN